MTADVETWGTSRGHVCREVGRRHWSLQMQGQVWSPIPNVLKRKLAGLLGSFSRDKLPPAAQVAKQLLSS